MKPATDPQLLAALLYLLMHEGDLQAGFREIQKSYPKMTLEEFGRVLNAHDALRGIPPKG